MRFARACCAAGLVLAACSDSSAPTGNAPGSSTGGAAVGSGGHPTSDGGLGSGGTGQAGGASARDGSSTVGGSSGAAGSAATGGGGGAGETNDATGIGGARDDGGKTGDAAGISDADGKADVGDAMRIEAGPGDASVAGQGPCDIYGAANTPCVAAHSTARALYAAYSGPLYQLRRASDKTTKDVPVLTRGGFADISVHDAFCSGTTCTISIIYDQSPQHNHLPVSPKTAFMPNGALEANAADGKITVSGHTVHGIFVTGDPNFMSDRAPNVAYRLNATKGIATGDQPESMYMVLDGTRFSSDCCFDYGNAETSGSNDGNGTMEALYWGSDTQWSLGVGNGPWVCADLENGMYKGNVPRGQSPPPPTNTPITGMAFVTTMLKGYSGDHFALKAGNAQSGALQVKWDGTRPPGGYSPKRLEGAIILGTGGDGSQGGTGTFFEGAMTAGVPSDAVDSAVHANIVAAGYGR